MKGRGLQISGGRCKTEQTADERVEIKGDERRTFFDRTEKRTLQFKNSKIILK